MLKIVQNLVVHRLEVFQNKTNMQADSKEYKNNNQVVVVSSAMSGETNKLVNLAENFNITSTTYETI